MGFDKLLAPLGDRSVLQHSLDRLLECDAIHSIVVVCPQDRWQTLRIPTSGKHVLHTTGGTLRQDSVQRGITAAPAEATLIAIHDAARPLVSQDDLTRVIAAATESGAASLAHRIVDTLKRADENQFTRDSVSRDHLWGMETPQVFALSLLRQALSLTQDTGQEFTDEVSHLQSAGHPVLLIESLHPNPKITTPADLTLAAALMRSGAAATLQ
jgi:2-C-methyl-D-erythritol 4-phosphate cytidylyltransferase